MQTGTIQFWWDGKIPAGEPWREEIDRAMASAQVAVLLVSAPFLASKFITEVEMPHFVEAARQRQVQLLWVPVSPCLHEDTPLAHIQAAHDPDRPLSTLSKARQVIALKKICQEIEKAARRRPGVPVAKHPLPGSPRIEPNVSISHLPVTSSLFIGRETERAELDTAWDDPATNVFSLVAFGGVGKSALANAWLKDLQAEDWRGAERVFGWSFYSQGTDATGASGDSFVNEALWWFGYQGEPITSPWEKGVVLARLIRERRTLLILDGLEPLQHPPGAQTGRIKDPAVAALVRELAVQNHGLCVITTRLAVADVAGKAGAASRDLEKLPPEAGAALLRELSVKGTDSELRRASEEFGGHALALTLLGTYLRDVCDGDIRRRREVPLLEDDDEHAHARRVIAKYAEWLEEPELQALRILGLFDRPAQPDALKTLRAEPVIADLTDAIGPAHETRWRKALARLREARLILEGKEAGTLDAHPLVRAYFRNELEKDRPNAWREGNLRLYEHLKGAAPEFPETVEAMEPLFAAVVHGCRAGRQMEALDKVYWRRIQRGEIFYSKRKLGALASELTALSGFFDHPWDRPSAFLTPADQAFVLSEAGVNLRALGRLEEAVQPMQAGFEASIAKEDWKNAAIDANNLGELTLTLGKVPRAVAFGKQSVELADRSGDAFQRMARRSTLADSLHQAGRLEESAEAFREAEALQGEDHYPRLYSQRGYKFCDLLLSLAEPKDGAGIAGLAAVPEQAQQFREVCREVQGRAAQTLKRFEDEYPLGDIALDHLTLGRAYLGLALTAPQSVSPGEEAETQFAQSTEHLDRAVDGLRQSGNEDYLPRGLLARAAFRRLRSDLTGAATDLTEALEIAERGSMRLHACDAHIEWARLCLQQGDVEMAQVHVVLARKLVDETGYVRREREVGWLERRLGAGGRDVPSLSTTPTAGP